MTSSWDYCRSIPQIINEVLFSGCLGTQCTCDNTTLYEGVWSQISHQIWARVIITRLILPIDKGLASVRAGTREPGLLFLSGKDEKTHLVYENGCFVNIHGMR
ncbi:hypothetical protein HanXRQr2_Chr01g0021521 [Helianthus annuus]|uniref:Uncharacterized protein n=1 Tax=Helianthus annuus TaxID=4232 RepID=A0A9K3JUN1_HELAN|nr:hypothetical protein HanXRQr2_Chr01g0021521 [Helianthus annuus]KAJ0956887.1 hypothetical protein HanPSC8_Chr01g0020811 [Helianthus annuus]